MLAMTVMAMFFVLYLFVTSLGYWLRSINLSHLKSHGAEVPSGFEGTTDAEILARTAAYTLEQSRLGLIESVVDNILLLAFLFGGLLDRYDRWISSLAEAGGLLGFYLAFRFLQWGGVPGLIGLTQCSFPAQMVILMFLGSLVAFPLTPLSRWLSRRHEWRADQFAGELSGAPDALAAALMNYPGKTLPIFTLTLLRKILLPSPAGSGEGETFAARW